MRRSVRARRRPSVAGAVAGLAAVLLLVACSDTPSRRLERIPVREVGTGPVPAIPGPNRALDMEHNGEFLVARLLIDPGDVVVDVGAHIGHWSRYVLEQHPGVRVFAFEPTPDTFAELEKTLTGTPGVPVKMALSDRAGSMTFYTHPKISILNSFYDRVPETLDEAVPIEVATERLDRYAEQQGLARIDFVKIDTEGAELLVLQGASRMLERQSIGFVQYEYGGTYPDAGITLEEVFGLLAGYGYEQYRMLGHELVRIPAWRDDLEDEQIANYLAVAP